MVKPQEHSSTNLTPAIPAEEAVRALLLRLLNAFEQHVDGVRADTDLEELHDLRVAARRSRTLTGELRRVFPTKELRRFRRELRWIADATGSQRDLDVFLASLRVEDIGGADQVALAPFIATLQEQRADAHRALVDTLSAPRTMQFRAAWRTFLGASATWIGAAADAHLPTGVLAQRAISTAYQRIVDRGSSVGTHPSVAELHALRIDAKKLRYLTEQFADLAPRSATKPIIRELKRLQDVLGGCQDLRLQLELTARAVVAMVPASQGTLDAVERLQAVLTARQLEHRADFPLRFQTFLREVSPDAITVFVDAASQPIPAAEPHSARRSRRFAKSPSTKGAPGGSPRRNLGGQARD